MKKKILGLIAVLVIAAVATINVSLSSQNRDLLGVSLANVEALANGETSIKYDKIKSSCTKEFTIDAQGYVTIRKKKIYIGGVSGSYTQTVSDVQIDCPRGSQFDSCSECSCANYWDSKC